VQHLKKGRLTLSIKLNVPFIDIHTHHPVNSEEIISVSSIFLQEVDAQNKINTPFSAAIHPWHSEKFVTGHVRLLLENVKEQPNLIAIGETGLDKFCSADYERQKSIFRLHVEFAEQYHKPLVIHAVKSWNELIIYLKHIKVPCILHGYSERAELTKQLIEMGCYFSIGKSILKDSSRLREAFQLIPVTSLFLETDDSQLSIIEIYREASKIIQMPLDQLKIQLNENFNTLFCLAK
jgi:TatD DNase family protein